MLEKFQNKGINDIHLYISHFFDHFIMLIFAKTAYDAGIYFKTSYEDIIGYGVLGFVLFGAVSPLSARLADCYSRSLLMVIFHFGIGFSALIASFSQSLGQLMIALGFLGAFASIYHPVGIALLLKNPNKVGLRLGINGVFGNMGVAAAPLVAGALLVFGDWRTGFWVSGLLCLIYGVIFARSLVETELTEYLDVHNKSKLGFLEGWQRALFALAMCAAAGGFIFGAMTFLVPRYFEIYMSDLSTSVLLTGLLASVVYAIASFSQVAIGWLIDRVSPKSVLIVMSIGQMIFIYVSSLLTDLSLFIAMILAMCFVFGQVPITDAILARYVPDMWRSRILSIKFLINLSVGAAVLPFCGLFLKLGFDMTDLFALTSTAAIFLGLAAFILPKQTNINRA